MSLTNTADYFQELGFDKSSLLDDCDFIYKKEIGKIFSENAVILNTVNLQPSVNQLVVMEQALSNITRNNNGKENCSRFQKTQAFLAKYSNN